MSCLALFIFGFTKRVLGLSVAELMPSLGLQTLAACAEPFVDFIKSGIGATDHTTLNESGSIEPRLVAVI